MQPRPVELLTSASLTRYLTDLGIRHVSDVRELSGGVSNVVLYASSPEGGLVVKQSLPRLNVAEVWLASQERTIREADALRAAAAAIPGSVPEVVALDEQRYVLVIEAAPLDWATWKQHLLAGEVDVPTAAWLGGWLGRWQGLSPDGGRDRFGDNDVFLQLRVDPYYRVAAARNTDVADVIDRHVAAMLATRTCFVHGDYSPKNILVGGHEPWVIDFEVVHFGDPVFDLAFMLNHLLLKSLHRGPLAGPLRQCAAAFLAGYRAEAPTELVLDERYLHGHVGCLMLARVDGKSPAEYLTEGERERARVLAYRLLTTLPAGFDEVWAARDEVCAES
jgi:aminoglycoside phosphotransferase (APT) family kinase protein